MSNLKFKFWTDSNVERQYCCSLVQDKLCVQCNKAQVPFLFRFLSDAPICQSQLVDQLIGVTAEESISINCRVSTIFPFFRLILLLYVFWLLLYYWLLCWSTNTVPQLEAITATIHVIVLSCCRACCPQREAVRSLTSSRKHTVATILWIFLEIF